MKSKKTMKKVLFIAGAVVLGAIAFTGCSKDDVEAPVITLTGGDVTINIGETFVDPGYTASDDEDGDITARVTVDESDIDETHTGTYVVTYSVSDDAGNSASESRNVIVQNSLADYNIAGIWNVSETCGGGPSTYKDTIKYSETVNGRIIFTRFANYLNGAAYADIINISSTGGTIDIPSQDVVCGQAPAPTRNFSGTGTLNLVSNTMTIPYVEVTNGTSNSCTGNYTK